MNKTQVLLVIIALLLVAGLYSLPKVVVQKSNAEGKTFIDESVPGGIVDHSSEIPQEIQPKLVFWKDRLFENNVIQPNLESLDSLMAVFMSINKYDSAAHYAALYAEEFNKTEYWQKAGDAYYEASLFALERQKIDLLGSKARQAYEKVLDVQPDNLDVKHNVALTLVNSSSPMQGIMMLRENLEQDPKHLQTLMSLGRMAIRTNQYENAVSRFEALLGYYPQHIEGNFFLGVCYYETGQLAKAKTHFNKVKELGANEQILTAVDEYLERIS